MKQMAWGEAQACEAIRNVCIGLCLTPVLTWSPETLCNFLGDGSVFCSQAVIPGGLLGGGGPPGRPSHEHSLALSAPPHPLRGQGAWRRGP